MTEAEKLLLHTLESLEALYTNELALLRSDLELKEKKIENLVSVCQAFRRTIEELSNELKAISAIQVEMSQNQINLQQQLAKTIKR